jgi:hypothetical protein
MGGQIFTANASGRATPKHEHEKQGQQLGAPAKGKRKTRRVEAAGLRPSPAM